MKRIVAILSHYESRRNKIIDNICAKLDSVKIPYCIVVPSDTPDSSLERYTNVLKYNNTSTISAVKNLIIDTYKGSAAYIHIIEDDMVLDPQYILNAEHLMEYLNVPIISATAVDSQNMVYGILTPRLRIKDIGKPFDTIEFYSNESKSYICINSYDIPDRYKFNESMNYFYLSHNYWKRHHTDNSVPFLNFYPCVPGETQLLYRDRTIESHITKQHVYDASEEVRLANLRWEPETSIDGPIQYILNSSMAYNKTH